MAELLVQSHEGFIRLLPALPGNWPSGKVKGLVARGNITVDVEWKDGKLSALTLYSGKAQLCKLLYGGTEKEVQLPAGKRIRLNGGLEME
ncbi:glycoside hydrolase family 95-like protein [Sinomicrobium soli]|uniref:glycoside hydrolase family 95-like protein n=1 Tax=Sinomicrobium sp. N-1-3-6 TaxID=2219864 RepID=UPI0011BFC3C3|nr:hypothetical protein [Sinomicrobium sp. N-1-3-6]